MAASRTIAHATRDLFARNLRRLRQELGLTQEALSQESGLRQAHLSEAEAGKRNVSLDNISAIAHGLGVPVSRLFEEAPPRRSARTVA